MQNSDDLVMVLQDHVVALLMDAKGIKIGRDYIEQSIILKQPETHFST